MFLPIQRKPHRSRLSRALPTSRPAEQPFRRYREVLAEALARAAAACGVRLGEPGTAVLAATLPSWPVFADVAPALEALRGAGWKLAILSNIDDDLLTETIGTLPTAIDLTVTAEQVRSYKPAEPHFRRFRELAAPGTWVHVAQSRFHDIATARRFAIPCVWVNRAREPEPPGAADTIVPDLDGLADVVARIVER
ncbi:MAG: HAD family hydrolase [Egibacteraceae bacterium]